MCVLISLIQFEQKLALFATLLVHSLTPDPSVRCDAVLLCALFACTFRPKFISHLLEELGWASIAHKHRGKWYFAFSYECRAGNQYLGFLGKFKRRSMMDDHSRTLLSVLSAHVLSPLDNDHFSPLSHLLDIGLRLQIVSCAGSIVQIDSSKTG